MVAAALRILVCGPACQCRGAWREQVYLVQEQTAVAVAKRKIVQTSRSVYSGCSYLLDVWPQRFVLFEFNSLGRSGRCRCSARPIGLVLVGPLEASRIAFAGQPLPEALMAARFRLVAFRLPDASMTRHSAQRVRHTCFSLQVRHPARERPWVKEALRLDLDRLLLSVVSCV